MQFWLISKSDAPKQTQCSSTTKDSNQAKHKRLQSIEVLTDQGPKILGHSSPFCPPGLFGSSIMMARLLAFWRVIMMVQVKRDSMVECSCLSVFRDLSVLGPWSLELGTLRLGQVLSDQN